ncbi:hypothetical protein GNI_114910 [Gregarina niphandrodes]|uniref:Uncharacterized protein n=1 Tax=Gregarina niphandrodes TaxID=110365 RepID=A0A023B303_GRENI|nr:hypothetical protein GNI_114910 [Gregarina niphandrodes]EZG55307.1 hypothetical protein GNI_114910 [Gregarina niphandrodes]|eukprot:XP_011131650.1 hypothetical protein GNI_114910 [Gregarina niphandrodes]
MRTQQCKSAWLKVDIAGVLAGCGQGQVSSYFSPSAEVPPPPPMKVVVSRRVRDLLLYSNVDEVRPFLEENLENPAKLVEWLEDYYNRPQDKKLSDVMFLIPRRRLEEDERRQVESPRQEASKEQLNVPIETDGGQSCSDQGVPALVHWARCHANRDALSPAQYLRNLAILARWFPEAAYKLARMWFEQDAPMFTSSEFVPDLSVGRQRLRQVSLLWLGGDPNGFSDPLSDSISDAVGGYISDIGGSRQRGNAISCLHIDDVKEGYSTTLQSLDKLKGKHRRQHLERRYKSAYKGCAELFLATYFPEVVRGMRRQRIHIPPRLRGRPFAFPVGHTTKVFRRANYRSYDLREWAWMEELLVRTMLDKLIAVRAASTNETPEVIAAALQRPEPFTVSLSKEELYETYNRATDEVASQVAAEQASAYASRVALAFMTTAYNHCSVMDAA